MSYYPGQQYQGGAGGGAGGGGGGGGGGSYGAPQQQGYGQGHYPPQPPMQQHPSYQQQHHQQSYHGYPPQQTPGAYAGYPPQQGYGYPQPQPSPQPYGYGQGQPMPSPQPYTGGYGQQALQPQYPQHPQRPGVSSASSNSYAHGHRPHAPPTTAQQFGHGAPGEYTFQYSNCTGRRKALLIGINYYGQRGELKGCINDVKNLSTYLNHHFSYKREDMVILTDDQRNPMSQPSKANILRAMHWLVKDARPNDSLFFHYSGHGGQTRDLDGDEDDGYDEVIYPADFRKAGHIVDDEMHRILVGSLPPGTRLTAIFDSCHSGSALDLPYIYSTQGVLKEPNLAKEAGQGLLGLVALYARGDVMGMASQAMGLFKKATKGDAVRKKNLRTKTSPADVIMWSGSKDEQTSADTRMGGEATGALSWAFITSLKKNQQQSYVQLLNSIRDELSGRYQQRPQLSCSHPLNTDLLFVM